MTSLPLPSEDDSPPAPGVKPKMKVGISLTQVSEDNLWELAGEKGKDDPEQPEILRAKPPVLPRTLNKSRLKKHEKSKQKETATPVPLEEETPLIRPPGEKKSAQIKSESPEPVQPSVLPNEENQAVPFDDLGELDAGDWDDLVPQLEDWKEELVPEEAPFEELESVAEASSESPSATGISSLTDFANLKRAEIVGLACVLLFLLGGTIFFLSNTVMKLPGEVKLARKGDFPIKGTYVQVESASTYWRAPITDGANADAFRRGTKLLPVIEMKFTGGPAAIRVFFRNSEGETVGDGVSRMVDSSSILKIPATAGFEEASMYSAYRTSEGKPWRIEVFEAGASGNPQKYKKLFEAAISSGLR